MYINQIFELSMVLDNEKFRKILNRVHKRDGYLEENKTEYIDHSMAAKGVVVKYRDSQYRKKITVIVNANLGIDSGEAEKDRFIQKLDKRIREYFDYKYQMDDFSLGEVCFVTDIDVENHENVLAYLKVLQRIGRVKGYSPSGYDCFNGRNSFCLDGNSNGIEFMIYDLAGVLGECIRKNDKGRKKTEAMIRRAKGILRVEIRLAKPKAIRSYTNAVKISDQILELTADRKDIFLDVFTQIIPYGDYYKKDEAIEIIRKSIKDSVMRRKMLQLLTLVPEKKSLYLAQKAMNCRNIEKVMEAFAKINVSSVTISKRQDVKYLKNLYAYIFSHKS